MKIAVEGCCHGELDKIYESIAELEKKNGIKVDLLLICGDFQAVRNYDDLDAMAVPRKYQQLNTFYKYYNGEREAPVLTVFIGGNHEASNYMQELPYGGWVAPNIYYMGYAGMIQVGGLRIGGISGIFKGFDYNKGHFERPPYDDNTKKSVYHVRNLEVFRLKQISRPVDIFLSHDWPKGIYNHGNTSGLLRKKPFFREEVESNKLGSRPLLELLKHLQPTYWFAAHLHVKFAAHVEHTPASSEGPAKSTKFLALDKCLPRRHFLQVLDIPHSSDEGLKIKLDPEWVSILHSTNHMLSLSPRNTFVPGPGCGQRYDYKVSDEDIETTRKIFGGDMTLPENFCQTSAPIEGDPRSFSRSRAPLTVQVNPQTTLLCTMLDITDPNATFVGKSSQELLDESDIGLVDDADKTEDSGDDAVEEDDDLPSTIDSSMETSSNISSTWDSFHSASESINVSAFGSPSSQMVTSTPAKNIKSNFVVTDLDDNDEELQLILSAQKNKKPQSDLTNDLPSSTNSVTSNNCPSSSSPIHNGKTTHSNPILDNEASPKNPSSLTPTHEPQDTTPGSLNKRTSFGISGLCLSSNTSPEASGNNSNTRQPGKKREISDEPQLISSSETESSDSSLNQASGLKKLKRRNISVYTEPVE
ncbi:lariat debranching enzyme B-like [Physella acuta]|uniref:lariat debranching enzyme B-like n=1 Tax=Physella acuta TaxID=109671 RepID=UPI0027DE57FB|nr:lariat debranching enzyme B-like [Physella acuta]